MVGVRTPQIAQQLGGELGKPLPEWVDEINPKTGLPVGVDKGWGAGLGTLTENAALIQHLARQTQQWEYVLAKAYMASVPVIVADQLAVAYRNLPGVAQDAGAYARKALDGAEVTPVKTLGLLTSADAGLIQQLTGIDVTGFDYSMDLFGVKHTNSHHGQAVTDSEQSRGQRAVKASDYARFPSVLNEYDKMEYAGKSRITKRDLVRIRKTIEGEEYVLVLEVRTGRKTLALETAYIIT